MSPDALPPIADNLARVRERIAHAAAWAGRAPSEITLVAVSKTQARASIEAALRAGQRDFGENRPEEAHQKFTPPRHPERLHLIGPIQSRKAALALACRPVLIHSIDRLKIAHKLSELSAAEGGVIDVLFEINISGEETKFGFRPEDLRAALPELLALPGLRSHGLMTIPPDDPDPEAARPHFRALHHLRDELARAYPQNDWSQLSMGMSHDFEIAIEEGATLVRVGSAIFGPRQ